LAANRPLSHVTIAPAGDFREFATERFLLQQHAQKTKCRAVQEPSTGQISLRHVENFRIFSIF